ncbi:MAG: NifU family protein [Acidimicrobiia bacterium]|nr:NifU family protein [Acidimicrobiia bacterium]
MDRHGYTRRSVCDERRHRRHEPRGRSGFNAAATPHRRGAGQGARGPGRRARSRSVGTVGRGERGFGRHLPLRDVLPRSLGSGRSGNGSAQRRPQRGHRGRERRETARCHVGLHPQRHGHEQPQQPEPRHRRLRRSAPDLSGDLAQQVISILETQINPAIASHGGMAELVAVEEGIAYLRLGGGCQGCGMASVTLSQGIEVALTEAIPEIIEVRDVTDHASGENPFYESAKK